MENDNNIFCELCLNTINDKDYHEITNTIAEVLKILFLNMDVNNDDQSKSVLCSACFEKLYAAFTFKSKCLDTDDVIFPYINSEGMLSCKLEQVFTKEYENVGYLAKDHKICRLCFSSSRDGFVSIHDIEDHVINVYLPEINFKVTKDSLICKSCSSSLIIHSDFLKNCLNIVQKKSHNFVEPHADPQSADVDIKTEWIEIEAEESKLQLVEHALPSEEGTSKHRNKSKRVDKNKLELECTNKTKASYESKDKTLYKCEVCTYETIHNFKLTRHKLVHMDPSQICWIKCDSCDYKAKTKSDLSKHVSIHEDPSETQWYRCDVCDHITKSKQRLDRHMLHMHTDRSEIEWYKCYLCDYKSITKYRLQAHMVVHKDPSQIQWYKCDLCDLKFNAKGNLNRHMLLHEDPSKIHWYRCDSCNFKSFVKANLKQHLLNTKKCKRDAQLRNER